MKRSASAVLVLLLSMAVSPGSTAEKTSAGAEGDSRPAREQFVGTWDLVDYQMRGRDGEFTKRDYIGRIIYDAHGAMAAQLMRRGRDTFQNRREATAEQFADAYRGYTAYFGSYSIDTENGSVTHHVKSSLYQRWVGTDLVRYYEFSENELTLSLRREDRVVGFLVWEKRETD